MLSLVKNFLKKKKLLNHKKKLEQTCLMGKNFCSSAIYSQNTNNFQLLNVKINNLTGYKENVKIGNNCNISIDLFLNKKGSVSIGSYVYMNSVIARIDYDLRIGSHCMFGPNVKLWDTNNHQVSISRRIEETIKIAEEGFLNSYDANGGSIIIEDNVWIGMDVKILGPVIIGEGSIIAAGSIVTKNVPPKSFVAGVPAIFIKKVKD